MSYIANFSQGSGCREKTWDEIGGEYSSGQEPTTPLRFSSACHPLFVFQLLHLLSPFSVLNRQCTGLQVHVTMQVTPLPVQFKTLIECAGGTFVAKLPIKPEEVINGIFLG